LSSQQPDPIKLERARRRSRVDETGLALAGSMLQTQLYVNDHTDVLNDAILRELPDLAARLFAIKWVSPLAAERYAEYRDAAFIHALGLSELADALGAWWPRRGGPHWDALARVEFRDGHPGVLLVEGKSYPSEMYDERGCDARSAASLSKITTALAATQDWLGVSKPVESWLRPLYQTANRLAMLHWLLERLDGRAWLIHLCFLNDATRIESTREQWEQAFKEADELLGISRPIPNYAHVFVPGLTRPMLPGSALV
jgi:hypothetical protein